MSASPLLAMHDALLDVMERRLQPRWGDRAADLLAATRQLHRYAALLVRLAEALAAGGDRGRPAPEVTAPLVRSMLDTRRLRARYVGLAAGDPAWALMLAAYEARLRGESPSATRLGEAAGLAPSTALRWIRALCTEGILVSQADPSDSRIARISLTDDAAARTQAYLTAALRLSPLPL